MGTRVSDARVYTTFRVYTSPWHLQHPKIVGVHRGLWETLDVLGVRMENWPPFFFIQCCHVSTAKAQGSPQAAGHPRNHAQGALVWTQWGHTERCRRLLEAGLPSSTSGQSRPGLCLQSRDSCPQPPLGVMVAPLPCGPWSYATHSGSGKICALTPALSLSDIRN